MSSGWFETVAPKRVSFQRVGFPISAIIGALPRPIELCKRRNFSDVRVSCQNVKENVLLGGMFAVGAASVAAVVAYTSLYQPRVLSTASFSVPGQPGMSADVALQLYDQLTPALLLEVYAAFGLTDEDAIYDTLARVTDGDALEYLYLERVGAMAGGGLEEADQTIHELLLLDTSVVQDGMTLEIDASWQVIGTVGHAEHLHVRGNTYSANLSVAPVAGAWRITEFDLLSVDRDTAGDTFVAPDAD